MGDKYNESCKRDGLLFISFVGEEFFFKFSEFFKIEEI